MSGSDGTAEAEHSGSARIDPPLPKLDAEPGPDDFDDCETQVAVPQPEVSVTGDIERLVCFHPGGWSASLPTALDSPRTLVLVRGCASLARDSGALRQLRAAMGRSHVVGWSSPAAEDQTELAFEAEVSRFRHLEVHVVTVATDAPSDDASVAADIADRLDERPGLVAVLAITAGTGNDEPPDAVNTLEAALNKALGPGRVAMVHRAFNSRPLTAESRPWFHVGDRLQAVRVVAVGLYCGPQQTPSASAGPIDRAAPGTSAVRRFWLVAQVLDRARTGSVSGSLPGSSGRRSAPARVPPPHAADLPAADPPAADVADQPAVEARGSDAPPMPLAEPAIALAPSESLLPLLGRMNAPRSRARSWRWLWLLVGLMAMATLGLVVGAAWVALRPAPAVVEPTGWDGVSLPPAWVDIPFAIDERDVLSVGTSGLWPEADAALADARVDAVFRLVHALAEALEPSQRAVIAPFLPTSPSKDERDRIVARFERHVLATTPLVREQTSTWRGALGSAPTAGAVGVKVAARYRLDRARWDHAVATYTAVTTFPASPASSQGGRGIQVARRFPIGASEALAGGDLVIVGVEPWEREARVGDFVLAVEGNDVRTLEQFTTAAESAWARAAPGHSVDLTVQSNGIRQEVRFFKKAAAEKSDPFRLRRTPGH